MMLTDVYSFGLLIWRTFLDGEGFITLPGATQNASDLDKDNLSARKASTELTNTALIDINEYAAERSIPQECVDLFTYAIIHTMRLEPRDRKLDKAQAALRGIK
jgi:hypothetical protein